MQSNFHKFFNSLNSGSDKPGNPQIRLIPVQKLQIKFYPLG